MNDYKATHCFYCERPFGKFKRYISLRTKDHIIPKSKGGKDIAKNYKYCCKRCNLLKADFNPEQFAAHLRHLLAVGHPNIAKKTLEIILLNIEGLILEIAPYRHQLVKKAAKPAKAPETAPKQPTRPSTHLWWRSTLK